MLGHFIAGLTIPFDVRDLNIDHEEMKTTPEYMGVVRSLWLAVLVLMSGGAYALPEYGNSQSHSLLTAVLVSPRVYKKKRNTTACFLMAC